MEAGGAGSATTAASGAGEGGGAVAYFISDHGFGHAARSVALLAELVHRGTPVLIVSKVPHWFFAEGLPETCFDHLEFQVDVGAHQTTSVSIDPRLTLDRLEEHWRDMDSKVEDVAAKLRSWKWNSRPKSCSEQEGEFVAPIEKIVFDITAMAPRVAEKLGIPSIAITNFTWDWIYEPFVAEHPGFRKYIELHKQAYAKTTCYLELTYSDVTALAHCPRRPIPWLVRNSTLTKEENRNKLGLLLPVTPPTTMTPSTSHDDESAKPVRLCLYSFGGHEFPLNKVSGWNVPRHWRVVLVDRSMNPLGFSDGKARSEPNGVIFYSQKLIEELGLTYVDLVAAMDLVVCKTGYGIVSECIRHGVSVLYTDRPGFIEHPSLERALKENVSCGLVELDDVLNATPRLWEQADAVVPNIKCSRHAFNGAEVAAEFIIKHLPISRHAL